MQQRRGAQRQATALPRQFVPRKPMQLVVKGSEQDVGRLPVAPFGGDDQGGNVVFQKRRALPSKPAACFSISMTSAAAGLPAGSPRGYRVLVRQTSTPRTDCRTSKAAVPNFQHIFSLRKQSPNWPRGPSECLSRAPRAGQLEWEQEREWERVRPSEQGKRVWERSFPLTLNNFFFFNTPSPDLGTIVPKRYSPGLTARRAAPNSSSSCGKTVRRSSTSF